MEDRAMPGLNLSQFLLHFRMKIIQVHVHIQIKCIFLNRIQQKIIIILHWELNWKEVFLQYNQIEYNFQEDIVVLIQQLIIVHEKEQFIFHHKDYLAGILHHA